MYIEEILLFVVFSGVYIPGRNRRIDIIQMNPTFIMLLEKRSLILMTKTL